ncbi:MAG: hypothetical protein HYU36_01035 [Planctomycetes bacterium]|nr:hypothetical protein [Planctomycetota bacterium]
MFLYWRPGILIVSLLAITGLHAQGRDPAAASVRLLLNGGFEEDDDNLRGEVMSCPVRPRVTYGQADGLPDRWGFVGAPTHPETARHIARVRESHSGLYGLRLKPSGEFRLNQTVAYALLTTGDAVPPPLFFSAWMRGTGGGDTLLVELGLQASLMDEKTRNRSTATLLTARKEFPAGPEWREARFEVSSAEIQAALEGRLQPAGLLTAFLGIQASKDSRGVLLDDVELVSSRKPLPGTLVPNAGFESVDRNGYPKSWSPARKSLRFFGSNYYVWRDWFHFFSLPRGAQETDGLVVHSGVRSFRMNVPPGDDKHIESETILLNQAGPRRMALQFDYQSLLLANLVVQVVDADGQEVFAANATAGTTGGWTLFQSEFVPRRTGFKGGDVRGGGDLYGATGEERALQSCRVRIGVKGVNGSEMDDINEWVNVNHAGALWIDNVLLTEIDSTSEELARRGVKTFKIREATPALAVQSIHLGERLYGENVATVALANSGPGRAAGSLTLTLSGPYRETDPRKVGYAMGMPGQDRLEESPAHIPDQTVTVPFQIEPGGRAALSFPYTLSQLLPDWRSEYRVRFTLDKKRSCEIPVGTWSQAALVEVERCYVFSEVKTQTVFMNIGVSRKTLSSVETLRLEVRRARDDQVVVTRDLPDFPRLAEGFHLVPLPPDFQGDNTNFLLTDFPLDALPVHPQDHPVRDHFVRVAGLDSQGKVVFEGRSPRFGRMEAHSEKLDPIQDVRIHPDNYLLVNGQPFFTRGQIWMQQNTGPAPYVRKNTHWKRYGFNVKAGVQEPFNDAAADRYGIGMDQVWSEHNTYVGSQMVSATGPLSDATRVAIQKWVSKPYLLGLHFIPWEGVPDGKPDEEFVQYARDIKALIGSRPLWISSGWYAPGDNGRLYPAQTEHDWFMPENNSYFQPSQLDKEILPIKKKRGQPCVLGTYPNVFNDTPWNVQRFEHWTEIIRHNTGYMQIGKPGDPTLMAGMNGELRFIEAFLFSREAAPEVVVSPDIEHLVRARGGRLYILATNAGPGIGGDWEWSTEIRQAGRASHTGSALWSRIHDYMKDTYNHFYRDDQPVTVESGDRIVQYVFIPKKTRVEHLSLMARGNGEWRYHAVWGRFDHREFTESGVRLWMAKDMHQMSWGSIGIGFCGPEGHDLKHPQLLKHTFTEDQFHRMGDIPRTGEWARLEAPVDALGLAGQAVDGFGYLSRGDKVWWERTLLLRAGKERTLCDGSVGIPPEQLRRVRFQVAGLQAGMRIKVCFEEREITAQEGYFEDDLSGDPGYRNLWVGLYGDRIGETGYYGDGCFYNYNFGKVAVRLYEVSFGGITSPQKKP